MRIAVFGLGYVGTVTAAGLASRGHEVCGVDVDTVKVDLVSSGRSPVVEPGIEEIIKEAVSSGRLRATTDAREALDRADVSLLCVGTPTAPGGDTDLTYLRQVVADIRQAMETAPAPASGLHAVVVRSTVPIGTGQNVVAPAFADPLPAGWEVVTAMCPEFLREGSGVADFFDPPIVAVGSHDPRAATLLEEMFAFLGKNVERISIRSAEALKYSCNAFHAVKVSFTNEMSRIFRAYDIDSREVMEIFSQDTVLNISPAYLRPGFAFGGSCLPKDLRALLQMARNNALEVPLLAGTLRTNEIVVSDVVDRLVNGETRTVAMLGLSFKMDTDDLRESPNVELAERLIGKGFDVRIYDPIINPEALRGANLRYVEARLPHLRKVLQATPEQAMDGAGAAVIATSDPAAVKALVALSPARVIDLHGRLGADVEGLPGYEGLGWVTR